MRNYDFNERLDWKPFQNLACEIVQYREQIHFQTFRDGKDKGIDGLWFQKEENIILQAKRYRKFTDLYRVLRDEELPHVQKLRPKRYILVVSLSLSEEEAEKIYGLFSGYITRSDDLLDRNALNRYLSDPSYHWIEKNFTGLWIPDASILEEVLLKIMNKGARNRNSREQRKAIEGCRTFVQTGIYNEARQRLEDNHVVVISGQPGMGKTTIARMLALDFLSIDCWEGFYWVSSLEEIENEWDDFGQKQVFILDDYWGAVFHRERGRKENYLLEELIGKFRASDNKWLIITAREYIVQQELFLNPELEDIIKNLKMECVLKEYTDAEKAEILFAHLKASDLDIEYVRSIYYNCDHLVYSRGYSPRVIDKFLKQPGYEAYSPWEYAQELLEWIKYPELMWKGVFAELSEEAKMLSAIVAISYTPINIEDIRNTYSRYVQLYKGTSAPKSFDSCISELEETVLLTSYDVEEEEIIVEFENPSIVDFLQGYLLENQEYYIPHLAKCSTFYNQLLMLLEHFHCHDENINQMIEKCCVEEFYKLPMKLEDYGDSDLGESIYYFGSDWAGRAFHLMRLSQGGPEGVVWDFIREFVNEFWRQIEKNTLFDGIHEMSNFVGLIRVCEESGMHFDGRKVIEQYWNHCFLYYDYESVDSLIKVYPKCSVEWREKYTTFMKNHVKGLILKTLLYYDCACLFSKRNTDITSNIEKA